MRMRYSIVLSAGLVVMFSVAAPVCAQSAASQNATNAAAQAAAAKKKRELEEQMQAALRASNDRAIAEAREEAAKLPVDPAATLALHDGDPVEFKSVREYSSKDTTMGQPLQFVLAKDLKVGNTVVARAGTRAMGEAVWVQKLSLTNDAVMLVRLDYLKLGDRKVLLRGSVKLDKDGIVPFRHDVVLKEGAAVKGFIGDDVKVAPASANN